MDYTKMLLFHGCVMSAGPFSGYNFVAYTNVLTRFAVRVWSLNPHVHWTRKW
jgi:hypothetical protein